MTQLTSFGTRVQKRVLLAGSAAYDSGNTSRIKINPAYLFRRFYMRLIGSMNISVAGTVQAEAPQALITKLSLIADGGRTIWSAAARDLFRLAHFEMSKVPESVPPTGTGTAVPIAAEIPFSFEALRRVSPADSLFDSAPYADLQLEIQWAAMSAIYSGGTAAINPSTKLELVIEDTVKGHDRVGLLKHVSYIDRTITGTQPDFELPFPKSGILDKVLIHAYRDGLPVDDLINAVTFRFDDSFDVFKNLPWKSLQNIFVKEYSPDGGAAGTGRISGYALLDPVESGMLSSAPNLRGMVDPKLVLDVTQTSGVETVRATFVTFELVQTAEAAA